MFCSVFAASPDLQQDFRFVIDSNHDGTAAAEGGHGRRTLKSVCARYQDFINSVVESIADRLLGSVSSDSLLVDEKSDDQTLRIIRDVAEQHAAFPVITYHHNDFQVTHPSLLSIVLSRALLPTSASGKCHFS